MASSYMNSTTSALGQTIGQGVTLTTGGSDGDKALVQAYLQRQQEEADREYAQKKRESWRQYQVSLMNAKSEQERNQITKWYNEQQVALAQARLAEDERQTLASLHGPADWAQATAYARGVANDPNSLAFVKSLQSGVHMADYGAQQGVPEAETGNTLTQKLSGTYQAATGGTTNASGQNGYSGGTGDSTSALSTYSGADTGAGGTAAQSGTDQRLAQIKGIYQAGAHKLNAGALENLSPSELALLKSGIEANGGDWSTFTTQYNRSRIGQGVGMQRAA